MRKLQATPYQKKNKRIIIPKLCLLVTIILILLATIIGIITPVWQNGKIISSGDEIKAANEAQPRAVSVTYKDWADYTKLPSMSNV